MFTQNFSQTSDSNLVKSHLGVDLENVKCYKLQPNAMYSSYDKNQLHYVIDAVQKGLKPHTKIGLKRLNRKNSKRHQIKKLNISKNIPALNPLSPETICMKALRAQFRNSLQNNHMQIEEAKQIQKSQKIIKRKQKQRKRRNQLIRLTKKYKTQLQSHFGNRLIGFGISRCPKISRKQIKDYLLTLGIEAKLDPVVHPPTEQPILDNNRTVTTRIISRGIGRIPSMRGQRPMRGYPPMSGYRGQPPMMGGQPMMGQPPMMGLPPMIGQPMMGQPILTNVIKSPPVVHTPPVLKDEDFPSLLP